MLPAPVLIVDILAGSMTLYRKHKWLTPSKGVRNVAKGES
jgi:hypothetical protein